jgi:hypothetical protein
MDSWAMGFPYKNTPKPLFWGPGWMSAKTFENPQVFPKNAVRFSILTKGNLFETLFLVPHLARHPLNGGLREEFPEFPEREQRLGRDHRARPLDRTVWALWNGLQWVHVGRGRGKR